jgi:hypothetical protein
MADDRELEVALRRLEAIGAIVKPYRVAELDLAGIVVRLGDEHNPDERMITRAGRIAPAVLVDLPPIANLLLEIRGTALADAGLPPLAELANLIGLDLAGTQVTGQGLVHVAKCRALVMLDLSFTPVDDASMPSLASLAKLRFLSVLGTKVTPRGLAPLAREGRRIVR